MEYQEVMLAEEVRRHNKAYWVLNDPIIADDDYDRLVEALREFNPDHPVLHEVKGSWPDTGRPKVQHPNAMLSLNKVYSGPEVVKWAEGVARSDFELFTMGVKLDGCAGILYPDGVLATRGEDGTEGENVSDKMPHIDFILDRGADNDVRGEVVVTKKFFEGHRDNLVRSGGQRYKNTRSACVALLMQEGWSPKLKGLKALTFVDYDTVSVDVSLADLRERDWEFTMKTAQ